MGSRDLGSGGSWDRNSWSQGDWSGVGGVGVGVGFGGVQVRGLGSRRSEELGGWGRRSLGRRVRLGSGRSEGLGSGGLGLGKLIGIRGVGVERVRVRGGGGIQVGLGGLGSEGMDLGSEGFKLGVGVEEVRGGY